MTEHSREIPGIDPPLPPDGLINKCLQQWKDTLFPHTHESLAGLVAVKSIEWATPIVADYELKCCEAVVSNAFSDQAVTGDPALVDRRILAKQLRSIRRPKPASLAEAGLNSLRNITFTSQEDYDILVAALKHLGNLEAKQEQQDNYQCDATQKAAQEPVAVVQGLAHEGKSYPNSHSRACRVIPLRCQ